MEIWQAILHMFAQDPVSSAVGAIFAVTGLVAIRLVCDR
jgi:hypothetical protein